MLGYLKDLEGTKSVEVEAGVVRGSDVERGGVLIFNKYLIFMFIP